MAVPAQPKCLVFDLEVVPATADQPARIIKLGALRPDTGAELELDTPSPQRLDATLRQLDQLAEGASFLLGHNLLGHDLPLLEAAAPGLALLRLPAIDTLRLSPLAFPQNPYHRLIKDYKLIRASLNSPLADCRATLALFLDQQQAFRQLHASRNEELLCYQALVAPQVGAGLGNFFMHMSGQRPLPVERLGELLPTQLRESDPTLSRDLKVCRTRLQHLLDEDLHQAERHWPLAYALAWLRVAGGNSVLAPWVRHQFPAVAQLIGELRDQPCTDPACQYCRSAHDPGFAGRQPAQAPIHQAITELQPGDPLQLRADGERHLLLDHRGRCVGRTSLAFSHDLAIEHCEVAGILSRYAEDEAEEFRGGLRCAQWEIVVPRLRGR